MMDWLKLIVALAALVAVLLFARDVLITRPAAAMEVTQS